MITISIPPVIVALIDIYAKKRKSTAEAVNIELKNKIIKDITYNQLKSENKQKDIKNKLEVFQKLVKLEEEIRDKKIITAGDKEKKLQSLEMIKKEFKETFTENPKKDTKNEKKEGKLQKK